MNAPVPATAELSGLAARVVTDALGAGATVVGTAVLGLAPGSAVLRVRLAGSPSPLALKLVRADERPRTDLARTAAATALARSVGVAVPEVLGVDPTGRVPGWQYLLQEHVVGSSWREVAPRLSEEERWRVHGEIAATLLALGSLRLPGFGQLTAGGAAAGTDLTPALRERAALRVGPAAARALAEELLGRYGDRLAAAPPTLCHDDLHHDNLLVRRARGRWRLAAVLDWDHAWAGPAESDLARVALWDDMTGPGFWSVYRAAVPETDDERERLAVHQLLWCLEYDASTPRHRADTAALARRLGLTPPVAG